MNTGRKYRRPPVVEALCELFLTGSAWDDTVPGRFYDRVKETFPVKRQRAVQEAQFQLSDSGEAAAGIRQLPPRMQFLTKAGDRLIQLGRDLLVVNLLPPYLRFGGLAPVVHWALDVYRDLAQPRAIAKLGVRYINRVVIPESRIALEDYFALYPSLPTGLGDEHGKFMVRLEIPARKGHQVLVTFGSAPAGKPEEIAFLLDLYDIFDPGEPFDLKDVQAQIQTAHQNVEEAFEGSVKDKLRRLFEPEENS